jgi:hypothetical protein
MVDMYNLDTIVMFNFTHINISPTCSQAREIGSVYPGLQLCIVSIGLRNPYVKSESGTNLVMYDVH